MSFQRKSLQINATKRNILRLTVLSTSCRKFSSIVYCLSSILLATACTHRETKAYTVTSTGPAIPLQTNSSDNPYTLAAVRKGTYGKRPAPDHKQRAADYVRQHPHLPETKKTLILKNWFDIGFTTDEVRAALGDPDHKTTNVSTQVRTELWTYGSKNLYFVNGVLTAYQLNQ